MSKNSQGIFGQGGCFAFHPVYSGDCKYTVGIFKFMKDKPTVINPDSIWEESSSIDDCIQIAIWRIIPFCEVRNIFVVIYDQNSKAVKTYMDTDGLIQDLWKSFSNVPLMTEKKIWYSDRTGLSSKKERKEKISGNGLILIIPKARFHYCIQKHVPKSEIVATFIMKRTEKVLFFCFQGEEKAKLDIAKRMLERSFSLEDIQFSTGLSKKELEKL